MANYNFTFVDGALIYKDADGNTCKVGAAGGGGTEILEFYHGGPKATWNYIKGKFDAGTRLIITGETVSSEIISVYKANDQYVIIAGDTPLTLRLRF